MHGRSSRCSQAQEHRDRCTQSYHFFFVPCTCTLPGCRSSPPLIFQHPPATNPVPALLMTTSSTVLVPRDGTAGKSRPCRGSWAEGRFGPENVVGCSGRRVSRVSQIIRVIRVTFHAWTRTAGGRSPFSQTWSFSPNYCMLCLRQEFRHRITGFRY